MDQSAPLWALTAWRFVPFSSLEFKLALESFWLWIEWKRKGITSTFVCFTSVFFICRCFLFMKSQSNWHVNAKHGFRDCFCCSSCAVRCFLFIFPFLFSLLLLSFVSLRLLPPTRFVYMFCFHLDYNVRAKIMTCRMSNALRALLSVHPESR